tara:strand:- start:816 stop:1067 length:252 start_codon:yes stop_codon:yes gene_type:complete
MIKHVNVGTIGHIDHGLNRTTTDMRLGTGDYIDPTPWTPEDHERFKKAIERVSELENPDIKREVQKSISAGAGVIYVDEKVNK